MVGGRKRGGAVGKFGQGGINLSDRKGMGRKEGGEKARRKELAEGEKNGHRSDHC